MLISEFIDRTGFRPTEDYYHTEIEPEYNRSNLDKDAWCKQWKKNGGIQEAYDALCRQASNEYATVLDLEEKAKKLREENAALRSDNEDLSNTNKQLLNDRKERIDERIAMAYELLEISETYSSAELRKVVIDIIGFKAYIAYKLEHDKAIWKIDREEIIERMK